MLRFFRPQRSAPVARERLKVLLAHEHAELGKPDLVTVLRGEILAVIHKHISVEPEHVRVTADRNDRVSTFTVDIEIPLDTLKSAAA